VGFDVDRLFGQLYTTTEGIYGLPLGVMVNYVFLFILFAGFLHRSGAGAYFIRLSHAIAGRYKGGPAKTAVVASSMMATITGSSTANVVSTGAFTIPLMKKVGYKAETAGGIEVAASVGGQLTPPIMGAGAFIMAEWTGTPYLDIITMAAIPALIYYLSVGFYVHILATKIGLKPMAKEDIPPFWTTFLEGCHLFVPLVVLMGMLIWGYTPMTSVIYSMGALVVAANLRKSSRMGLKTVYDALQTGAVNAVLVTASLACAGILMCTIGLTGVGLKFSSIVLDFSGGNILLALGLVAFASLFLGMELPITAAYITCAVLAVPALKTLGVPLIAAHMIVFWFSMDSTITPPVCISAYAASGISGGHPLKTGFAAWKMAKALYILPVLFAFTAILTGSITEIILIAIPGCLGIFALTVAWEGFFMRQTMIHERLMMLAAMVLCLYPHAAANWIGVAVFSAVAVSQKLIKKNETSTATA
jgi:TRAP transporter 4TM/12TM fusion protein